MGKKANPAIVGAFVLGAIALVVLAVIMLGSGRLFQTKYEYVLFFDGNVNGLRVGAAVKFKGVEIGSVSRILLNLETGQGPAQAISNGIKIPVIIELQQRRLLSTGAGEVDLEDPHAMKSLIDSGLRGQLSMESFVTGVLYVDLDFHPGTPVKLVLPPGANTPYQEIPTVPTPLEQAQSAATMLIAQLEQIDFQKLSETIKQTLQSISQLVTSPQLKAAVGNLATTEESLNRAAIGISQTAVGIRQTALKLDKEIGPLTSSLRASSQAADVALTQARATLASMQDSFGEDSPLVYQAGKTMQDLDDAARSAKQLAEYLQRNPSAPVRGRYLSRTEP